MSPDIRNAKDPLIGSVFDERYRVLEIIGQGGMGTIYKAHQIRIDRAVALKVLRPELLEQPDMADRFIREARLASRLNHPNTIVIHDFGRTEQGLFIAMELLEGETVRARLERRGAFHPREALTIAHEIAASLEHAHQHRVVHRDMKPDNVFLHRVGQRELVKVLDFGIAKLFSNGPTLSRDWAYQTDDTGEWSRLLGTCQYMAPEQIEGEAVDARADLYSLGIVLYEMLSNDHPYPAETVGEMMRMHVASTPRPLPTSLPAEIQSFVTRLLQKHPNERPSTASEVEREARRLLTVLGGPGTGTVEPSAPSTLNVTLDAEDAEQEAPLTQRLQEYVAENQQSVRTWGILLLVLALLITAAVIMRHRKVSTHVPPPTPGTSAQPAVPAPTAPEEPTPAPQPEPAPAPNPSPTPTQVESPTRRVAALPPESNRRAWIVSEAGRFQMGNASDNAPVDESPQHAIEISHQLLVRAAEITQAEWLALVDNNPSEHKDCPDCPVENVNWYEALAFCNRLSEERGRATCYELSECTGEPGEGMQCQRVQFKGMGCEGYRLPTEAEWEYLASAQQSEAAQTPLRDRAWFAENSGNQTRPGRYGQPNRWGLRDMLGNVAEWVWDAHGTNYYQMSPPLDPTGPAMGEERVTRGCGCNSPAAECTIERRRPRDPIILDPSLGFRVVRKFP